ncbi:hypothetical protein IQ276_028555 [Desmonostoc muscorum LEGE 12446]|uniref:Uncharacterized protein n=1 Tax=Desmonostoc muscorum LEGE 12446 TaxID=1828758 RepID=A0A8J6ZR54_DESMC|nr:hypothetical protein [Desmonostoc muscorum]MCF2150314.1 hypothetical protein [Desmonostoc muscorum LEGE 12446]
MASAQQSNYARFQYYVERLIILGVSKEIFEEDRSELLEWFDTHSSLKNHKKVFILWGDIVSYLENKLYISSKKTLKKTHKIYSRETFKYWCDRSGVKPRKRFQQILTEQKMSDACIVTLDEAIMLFNHAIRFKLDLGKEPGLELTDFNEISKIFLAHFWSMSTQINVLLLGK